MSKIDIPLDNLINEAKKFSKGNRVGIIPEDDFNFQKDYHIIENFFINAGLLYYFFGDEDEPEKNGYIIDLRKINVIYPC